MPGHGLRDRVGELELAARAADGPAERARILIALAEALDVASRSREALATAVQAEAEASHARDDDLVAWSVLRQGIARSNLGEVDVALTLLDDAAARFRATRNLVGQARARSRIAADLIDAGRPELGIDALVDATILFDRIEEPSTELADALATAADAHAALGSFAIAAEIDERVLAIAESVGDPHEIAYQRYGVALDLWRWGETLRGHDAEAARRRLGEGLAHARRAERLGALLGEEGTRALGQLVAGLCHAALGEPEEALAAVDAAEPLLVDAVAELSFAGLARGRSLALLGRPAEAIRAYDVAVPGLASTTGRRLATTALHERAVLRVTLGDLDGALADFIDALRLAEEQRDAATRRLSADVESRVRLARAEADMRRQRAVASAAEHRSLTDALTGIGNRRRLDDVGAAAVRALHADGLPCALAVIDVDAFKRVNDEHGHAAGDVVLRRVAELLVAGLRRGDSVFRYAGDEFVVLLPGADAADARASAERIVERVRAEPWEARVPGLAVTVTAGVACLATPDLDALFRAADAALLAAKMAGRDRVGVAG